jgi:hypothetical protein
VHRFFFAADSRLQQTEHAAASATECFLKRSAARRTGRNLSGGGLHLLGLRGQAGLDETGQRLPDLALNLFLSLGGHVELLTTSSFISPLPGYVENKAAFAESRFPFAVTFDNTSA